MFRVCIWIGTRSNTPQRVECLLTTDADLYLVNNNIIQIQLWNQIKSDDFPSLSTSTILAMHIPAAILMFIKIGNLRANFTRNFPEVSTDVLLDRSSTYHCVLSIFWSALELVSLNTPPVSMSSTLSTVRSSFLGYLCFECTVFWYHEVQLNN